jgi:hypothetical protein
MTATVRSGMWIESREAFMAPVLRMVGRNSG